MRGRTLAVLVLIAAAAIAAILSFDWSGPKDPRGLARGQLVLPPEANEPSRITAIAVRRGERMLTLARLATGWSVAENGGYPADAARVERALASLVTSRRLEPRTSNPEFYGRLDLEDPALPDAVSIGITLRAADNPELVSLVLGKNGPRIGDITTTLYARYAGDPQVWLIEGPIEFDALALDWLDRRLVDLKREEVTRLTVTAKANEFTLTRQTGSTESEGGKPEIAVAVAVGEVPAPERRKALMGLLANVEFQDVRRDDVGGGQQPNAVFTTASGMTLSVRLVDVPGTETPWARFEVTGAANARDDALASRVSGWLYELPDQVLQSLRAPLGAPAKDTATQ